jgi:hypothetical protein
MTVPFIPLFKTGRGRLEPVKGTLGGQCNRTACTTPGARWFNSVTRRYYCGPCAELINGYTVADTGQAICAQLPADDGR